MSTENDVNLLAPNPAYSSNFSLLSVLGRERLIGPNYLDWMRNLRFTLRYENKEYVLDEKIPIIDDDSTQEEIEAMMIQPKKILKLTKSTMMMQTMCHASCKERLDVVKSLMAFRPKPRASICAFVLEMKGYFDILEYLNMVFDTELSINIIVSDQLGKSNYRSKRKAEYEIASTSDPKESVCFYCNTKGHWKHSCPKYLKDLKDENVKKGSHAGIYETVECISHNGNVILNVGSSNDLDKSKLWHSRLRHVNKKCIAKLQKDGVLESFDYKSDDVCESCLLEESFGYLFYKPKDNVVFVARKGVFLEREMISKEDSGSKIDLDEIQESVDEEPIVNTDTQQEVVTHVKPDDISLPIQEKISDSTLYELDEPANYKEAMASLEAAKWKEAMKSEIQFMYNNQVWNLVDTTPGLKMVGCKWIFKKKTYMDGKVHTYKARLVAKGYTQTYGIDYEETFSPVAKIKSVKIMLAIAVFHEYKIWQMDVKTTFLNRKLTNDVFMAQPKRFENANGSVVVFSVLYVDDILLIGNNIPTLQSVKDWLGKCLVMKDLGDAAYIPGSIMYSMMCIRPDVSFALSMVSRYQQNPGEGHWTVVKNILKYLRNTKDRFLVYGGEEELRIISKQDTVADSTCESEYIAACEASTEAIWMKNFIGDLGVVTTVQDSTEIFYDNKSAIALTKEPKDHGKSKHIEGK
ncbi:retrotransposon protein, putative, ty1-copia subclass [Tanacetum coccineum]|uniref:Retrotransposon protein, putative, ty1-copia subclass n=1 Tax=Tanacetum coccineum TaxID=301880 RepID=A0ABQ5D2I2_9ASTR